MESFKHILQFQTVHSVQILYSVHSVYILYILNNAWFDMNMQGSSKPTAPSRGRPRSAPARTGAPLHRAHRWNLPKYKSICHGKDVLTRAMKLLNLTQNSFFSSCGSLKSRQGVGSGFWDILSDKSAPITILSQREVKAGSGVPKPGELTLTLTSVSAPLSLLHLQSGTSRSISTFMSTLHGPTCIYLLRFYSFSDTNSSLLLTSNPSYAGAVTCASRRRRRRMREILSAVSAKKSPCNLFSKIDGALC